MNAKSKLSIISLVIGAAIAAGPVMAQSQTDVPGHPRVNEVNNLSLIHISEPTRP